MINYKVVVAPEHGRIFGTPVAYVNYTTKTIGLGRDMNELNDTFKNKRGGLYPYYQQFTSGEQFYEQECETLLIHEYLHAVITSLESKRISDCLDNVDENNEISGFMIVDIEE